MASTVGLAFGHEEILAAGLDRPRENLNLSTTRNTLLTPTGGRNRTPAPTRQYVGTEPGNTDYAPARGAQQATTSARAAGQRRLDDEIRAFRLAEVRRNRSLTQREVADAMGVSGPRVSDVERGNLDTVSVSVLRAYVDGPVVGCPANSVPSWASEPQPSSRAHPGRT